MSEIKRLPAIVYLERTRIWYHSAANPSIFQLEFPPEIVNDLEVLNKDKFNELIKAFVGANKIDPGNIMVLLSPDITFEKDLPEGLPVEIEGETKNFLNFVPFDDTYSRPIKIGKTVKVVAVNKDLCNSIKNAFGELQFQVISLIPFTILHQTIPELANNLDLAFVLSHADSVKQYNLLGGTDVFTVNAGAPPTKTAQSKDNKRLYLFIGIFTVLILILGYVVYTNVIAPPATVPPTSTLLPTKSPGSGNTNIVPTSASSLSPSPSGNPSQATTTVAPTPGVGQ